MQLIFPRCPPWRKLVRNLEGWRFTKYDSPVLLCVMRIAQYDIRNTGLS